MNIDCVIELASNANKCSRYIYTRAGFLRLANIGTSLTDTSFCLYYPVALFNRWLMPAMTRKS